MEEIIKNLGIEKKKVDNIVCGSFNNKSYFGYSGKVLKSGVCKYYRRKQFDKFEWCIIEMMLFGIKNKGLLTNIINRIKILLMEEIICNQMGNLVLCINILNDIDNSENGVTGESGDFDLVQKIGKMLELCEIVKKLNRGRIVSYINNWWKYNEEEYNLDEIEIDKVKKFSLKNDSEEILKLGELFINFLEDKDERIFDIYTKLYSKTGVYGTRYRRKDAVYLLFQIIEDKYKSNMDFMIVMEFCKKMFFRKQMVERKAFGIWIIFMAWKYEDMDYSKMSVKKFSNEEVKNYLSSREKIAIVEDYVIKDYHVDKKYGIGNFGKYGSYVVDEDLRLLGSNGEKYRQYYIDMKIKFNNNSKKMKKSKKKNGKKKSGKESVKESGKEFVKESSKMEEVKKIGVIEEVGVKEKVVKKKKIIKKKKIVSEVKENEIVDEDLLKFIDWKEFKNVKVLEEGVCGLKVCCIRVEYKDKTYILKEMRPSFNLGRDYIFLDSLKKEFGVRDLGMIRIRSNEGLERKDLKKKTFVGNWKFGLREVIYCMMEQFINIGDLGKHKYFLEDDKVFKECLKIRLFDGLFRSSDNILRNILVNENGDLMSIDEGDIYGKRPLIFDKNNWFKKKENVEKSKKIIKEIIEEWNLTSKIELVKERLELFKFNDKIPEMDKRFNNYEKIVMEEFK